MLKKSRKKPDEHENLDRWLVSYADFMTLLFAFFVVLYATSTQNLEKERQFQEAIKAHFKMAGGVGVQKVAVGGPKGTVIEPMDFFMQRNLPTEDVESQIKRLLAQNMTEQERSELVKEIRYDGVGVRIVLNAQDLFPSGSAKLRLPALKPLAKIGEVLKTANRQIIVEGHTDDIPVSGGQFESNWELASNRATAVLRYFVKALNFPAERLAAMSYGDQRPLAPNTSEKARAMNRRIELLVINNDEVDL
jgi:chemotaxis protein MotB